MVVSTKKRSKSKKATPSSTAVKNLVPLGRTKIAHCRVSLQKLWSSRLQPVQSCGSSRARRLSYNQYSIRYEHEFSKAVQQLINSQTLNVGTLVSENKKPITRAKTQRRQVKEIREGALSRIRNLASWRLGGRTNPDLQRFSQSRIEVENC